MIKRYHLYGAGGSHEMPGGNWVLHSDHLRAMSALEEENKRQREELKAKDGEIDALKKSRDLHASSGELAVSIAESTNENLRSKVEEVARLREELEVFKRDLPSPMELRRAASRTWQADMVVADYLRRLAGKVGG